MSASTTRSQVLPPLTIVNGRLGYQFGSVFVPRMAGGETPPAPGETPPPAPNDDDPATWDKDRAANTIKAQRAREKTLSDELKAAKTQSDDMAARLKAIEDKDKSAGEKALSDLTAANTKLSAAEQRAADAEARYQAAQIRAAIDREAHKANAVDVDAVAALLDRSGISLDDDGNVTGADKAVAALLKAKPYLLAAEGGSGGAGVRSIPGTPKPNGAGRASPGEAAQKEIDSARATGRYSI